jgi:hypothetical protein
MDSTPSPAENPSDNLGNFASQSEPASNGKLFTPDDLRAMGNALFAHQDHNGDPLPPDDEIEAANADYLERQNDEYRAKSDLEREAEASGDERFVSFVSGNSQVCPISAVLAPVPEMDPRLIPEPFRAWLVDIAERASCPLDLPAMSAIVCLGAVVGRKIGMRPKRQDDWTVVPNLWGMGILPPGRLKTHAIEEPKKALARLEVKAKEDFEKQVKAFEVDKRIADAKAKHAQKKLEDFIKFMNPEGDEGEEWKRGKLTEEQEKQREKQRKLAEATLQDLKDMTPVQRRYVVNDTTVEKFQEILSENPLGLLQYRDELMGFFRTLERQGHEADRAFYLEGWNGTGGYGCDRIGRGSIHIDAVTISILGGCQPGVLASYIRAMASGDHDDGLISRFQLMVFPDFDKPFVNIDRWPASKDRDRAYQVFEALDQLNQAAVGADVDDWEDKTAISYLRFEDDAQTFFDGWRAELENRVRSSHEPACLISHLAKYRSLLPSLALLFHLIEVADKTAAAGPVSFDSARRAAAWCDYLEQHARRVYQMAYESDAEPAQRLAEHIKSGDLPSPFSPRQVTRKGWSGLATVEEVERALAMIEDHGWIYRRDVPPGPKGGRPTVDLYINPILLKERKTIS